MKDFDEQIKQRMLDDEEVFAEAFVNIAGSVIGKKIILDNNSDTMFSLDIAIQQIMKYYHVKMGEVSKTISNFSERIEHLLRPQGIMHRDVRLGKAWYKDAIGPMLGFFKEDERPVALIPSAISGYFYYDDKTGKKIKINAKNADLFQKEGIYFYKPMAMSKLSISDMIKYIISILRMSDIVWVIIGTMLVTSIGLLLPKLNQLLVGDVLNTGKTSSLIAIGVFMICVIIGKTLFDIFKELLTKRLNSRVSLSVSAASMMRILSLPPEFFRQFSSGELASRMGSINSFCSTVISTVLTVGLTAIFSLEYIAQIFTFSRSLAGVAIFIILLTVAFTIITSLVQMGRSKKQMEVVSKESGMTYSLINGMAKIKLSGSEKRAFSRWADLYSKEIDLSYNPPKFILYNGSFTLIISLIGNFIIFAVAIATKIPVQDYVGFSSSYGMVSGAFMSLASVATTFAGFKPIINMIRPILEAEPETAENKIILDKIDGDIEFSNVSFSYPDNDTKIVDNMSLKIDAGQYVAIVGKTGCGKSTLIRLMLGFEKPQNGSIFVDGQDIGNIDLKSLRRKIGTVLQDGKLFQSNIYSNIIISAPWLTVDEAWEAAEIAGLADDIRKMPMGMHTLITEGSGGISGGQKQRLMIARAVAPKPKILIFDEATSALDNITQKKISEALDELSCTRIVVAHRLSTIQHCDRILVLDGGEIIEDGTYDELIAKDGFFAELVERQRIDD